MSASYNPLKPVTKMFDLIQKYGVSGPRYTSYPPAPVFSTSFGPSEYQSAILERKTNQQNREISLYVHIPFCDTLCYFCGCTTMIVRNRTHIERYLHFLKMEIDLLARTLDSRSKVAQMHWGGGTPTYLSPIEIEELGKYILRSFPFTKDAEISVEVDPRELTYEHMRSLRYSGFNRISLGVQDFNPEVQHAVNRVQNEDVTHQAIDWSRKMGFKSLNVDLIYGLPLQTVRTFSETLDKVIEISPDRIAVYNFAYVPWMKRHQKLIHVRDLPSPESRVEIHMATIEKLSEAGYVYIGMDHFARPDDDLTIARRTRSLHRNFQGYSTKAETDLYGLGLSAISHFGETYAQNSKTLPEYYKAIDAGIFATQVGYRMSFDDAVRKFVIMRLMCDLNLEKVDVENKFGIRFDAYFDASLRNLEPLARDGLVAATPTHLIVSSLGRLFLRNIAMCFDAHLTKIPQEEQLYSRTV